MVRPVTRLTLLTLLTVPLLAAVGCAYPRRTTPLSPLPGGVRSPDVPDDMWQLVLVDADIPDRQRSGMTWDEDAADPPDPFVRVLIRGREVWQGPTADNTAHPRWNVSSERNLAFDRSERMRFELWDEDGMTSDPIGIYEGRALAEATVGADTILKLEGGTTLTVRLDPPRPHAGSGIALYEVRKTALVILEVTPNSPASRAGLTAGDRITAIDDRLIDELGGQRAASALAMAAQNQSELTVEKAGKFRHVKLDRGYVWIGL
jgi:hypothetical protein